MAEMIDAPPQEPPSDQEDAADRFGCVFWLLGMIALGIGGGLVALILIFFGGGNDSEITALQSTTVATEAEANQEQRSPDADTVPPTEVVETIDAEGLGIPLAFIPQGDGTASHSTGISSLLAASGAGKAMA